MMSFGNGVEKNIERDILFFVSEYNAPNDFECIWEKNIVTTLNNSKGKGGLERVEKLFKYKGE